MQFNWIFLRFWQSWIQSNNN